MAKLRRKNPQRFVLKARDTSQESHGLIRRSCVFQIFPLQIRHSRPTFFGTGWTFDWAGTGRRVRPLGVLLEFEEGWRQREAKKVQNPLWGWRQTQNHNSHWTFGFGTGSDNFVADSLQARLGIRILSAFLGGFDWWDFVVLISAAVRVQDQLGGFFKLDLILQVQMYHLWAAFGLSSWLWAHL